MTKPDLAQGRDRPAGHVGLDLDGGDASRSETTYCFGRNADDGHERQDHDDFGTERTHTVPARQEKNGNND